MAQEVHTGREDYDQLVRFRGLEPGEPFFMIRARDAVSGAAVRAWASLARQAGAPPALLEQALAQADALDAWPTKKAPDADHLTPAEQQQLTFRLERRAWAARADGADVRVLLAEERALTALRGSLRPLLRQLLEHGQRLDNGAFIYSPGQAPGDFDAIAALQNLDAVLRASVPTPREEGAG